MYDRKDIYTRWSHMHDRCNDSNRRSYKNVKVCDEWYNFDNFYNWVISDKSNYHKEYVLDKDILQWNSKNKIYSPDTCIFIPNGLNAYLGGIINRKDNVVGLIREFWFRNRRIYISSKYIPNKLSEKFVRYFIFDEVVKYFCNNYDIQNHIKVILKNINNTVNKLGINFNLKYINRELVTILKNFIHN